MKDYLYLPLKGRNQNIVLVLSPAYGSQVGPLYISSWLEDLGSQYHLPVPSRLVDWT